MKSTLTAFALLTVALGNYLSSAIITFIARVTKVWHSPGWIPDDLNKGHLDYTAAKRNKSENQSVRVRI
jgi:hypothetical protein